MQQKTVFAPLERTLKMKTKRSGILIKIIIAILIIYAAVSLVILCGKITDAKNAQADLQQEIEDVTAENSEMEYALSHSEEDEVKEDIARDKLGLVDPDEQIYYNQ